MSQIVTREVDCVEGHLSASVSWQEAMRLAYRQSADLLRDLGLDASALSESLQAKISKDFPLFVPREWAKRIRPGDASDPLLRQVLLDPAEAISVPGYQTDPVGDLPSQASPGLLHKYHGRALMITTGACAVHCRYCFRRHFPYQDAPKSIDAWQETFDFLKQEKSITEILLSGGDPLTLVDRTIEQLVQALESIPHLSRLRIHSRMPVVIPQRITDSLCKILSETRFKVWFVLHVNHPQELDEAAVEAIARLRRTGAVLLNQAVLLRGINDSVETLEQLCLRLVDEQVIPYYLNQLDRVSGAAHFEVPVATGIQLMDQLRTRLPGYALPRYVQDCVGQESKIPINLLNID